MKKGIIIFFLIVGYIFTVVIGSCDVSEDLLSQSRYAGITTIAYAEKNDDTDNNTVVMSINDMKATQGDTIEVPVNLSKNNGGITGFKINLSCKNLTPDASYGVGGYIKDKADDILYNFSEDSVLIVWGSGNGNTDLNSQAKSDPISPSDTYVYNDTNKRFFTVQFKIPDNAKVGTKYKISFSDSYVYNKINDTSIPITDNEATIEVVKDTKSKDESDKEDKEESKKDTKSSKDIKEETQKDANDNKLVSIKLLIFMGCFSVIAVLLLAVLLLYVNSQRKISTNNLIEEIKKITGK